MAIECLVVGHHETSVDVLARRLEGSSASSGGLLEIQTNAVRTTEGFLTYPEMFSRLAEIAYGTTIKPSAFRAPHTGAIYLASSLATQGINAEVLNYVSEGLVELESALDEFRPMVVAVTTTYYVDPSPISAMIECIRRCSPNTFIVVGGPYVVSKVVAGRRSGIQNLATLAADAFITDPQGEEALAHVVRAISRGSFDLTMIPNLALRNCTSVARLHRTETKPEANRLNEPGIRWSQYRRLLRPPVAYIRTARGCAFHCSFCNYPAMSGGHVFATVENTCEQLEQLRSLGVRDVAFVDDTFNVPLPRFKELLREIVRRRLDLRWTSFLRCTNADAETFDLMAASGCAGVFLGIESADPTVLQLMRKSARPDAYARGIAELTRRDILTFASYIIGFPGETVDSVFRTFDFITRNPTTFYNLQLYYHDRNSPIESRRDEFSLKGSGYQWMHGSMDWREASDLVRYGIFLDVGPLPTPLYGFSIWSLPFLQSLGLSAQAFKSFAKVGAAALKAGLNGPVSLLDFRLDFKTAITSDDVTGMALRMIPS
jgi:anaerobic magnesium-protoporphyrin IX monomethyl ester cyclase